MFADNIQSSYLFAFLFKELFLFHSMEIELKIFLIRVSSKFCK